MFPHVWTDPRRGRGILPKVAGVGFAWDVAAAEAHRADGCTLLVWQPAPCVLVTRVTGPGTEAILQRYMAAAERAMQAGPLRVFHDWTAMTRYDPAARDTMKRWGKVRQAGFVSVTYFVESKVIAMLVSVAALTMGRDLRATTDRAAFQRDLEQALAAR